MADMVMMIERNELWVQMRGLGFQRFAGGDCVICVMTRKERGQRTKPDVLIRKEGRGKTILSIWCDIVPSYRSMPEFTSNQIVHQM